MIALWPERRWSALLGLLVLTYLFATIADFGIAGEIVGRCLYMVVFAGTVVAADLPAHVRRAAFTVVLLWPVATLLDVTVGGPVTQIAEMALLSILLVGSLIIVFGEVSGDGGTQTDGISAAIFGYLLITLTFALFYVKLEETYPGSFDLGRSDSHVSSLVYFSLVTITTLGFGDITPVSRFARVIVGIEAALGLMYVAVFIGRVVNRR